MKILKLTPILFILVLTANCTYDSFEEIKEVSNKYDITSEDDLVDAIYLSEINDFFNSGIDGYFEGEKGINIYFKYFLQESIETEKGAIVISNGRTEAVIKYKELIFDLFRNGYSVYIYDHRGQGFSDRLYKPDTEMGHIDSFDYYVDDLKNFYNLIVEPNNHESIFLLAHSMGGTIATLYIEKYTNDFKALALTSPMFSLGFINCAVINIIKPNEVDYAPGKGNYNFSLESYEENTVTNSKIRFNILLDLFENNPNAKIGGPSYQWVLESCNSFEKIFDDIKNIKTPLILLQGGEEEIVDPDAHNKFIEELNQLGSDGKGYFLPNSKHEILIETDDNRIKAISKILEFFDSHG